MKIAVLYTGALRTIEKTIRYLKENVLLNENVHVFACLENDTERPTEEWEKWLRDQLGGHLKQLDFGKLREDWTFIHLRERILMYLDVTESWKGYLRNSGSIIEHYHIWLTNQVMCHYENTNKFKYDYVIRCRTDTIFGKPIDFHWLKYSNSEIEQRIAHIQSELGKHNLAYDKYKLLYYFMTTMIHDNLFQNIPLLQVSPFFATNQSCPESAQEILDYIQRGRYILTMRENLLYIIKREYFTLLPCVALLYGTLRYPNDDPIWFNSESQFKGACYNSNLTIFDYSTNFESKSLYEFDKNLYFDDEYNLKAENLLYCIVRK
jgi:hypothetical protein